MIITHVLYAIDNDDAGRHSNILKYVIFILLLYYNNMLCEDACIFENQLTARRCNYLTTAAATR